MKVEILSDSRKKKIYFISGPYDNYIIPRKLCTSKVPRAGLEPARKQAPEGF